MVHHGTGYLLERYCEVMLANATYQPKYSEYILWHVVPVADSGLVRPLFYALEKLLLYDKCHEGFAAMHGQRVDYCRGPQFGAVKCVANCRFTGSSGLLDMRRRFCSLSVSLHIYSKRICQWMSNLVSAPAKEEVDKLKGAISTFFRVTTTYINQDWFPYGNHVGRLQHSAA